MNYQAILEEIRAEIEPLFGGGKIADYIPALKSVNPKNFGIALVTLKGEKFQVGDAQIPFSIQSISKVFTLTMAFSILGESLWDRVGKEPSGNAFNSLVQLEYEQGIPRNPFINAGALVITDTLITHLKDPKQELLYFIRKLSGNEKIDYDAEIADSERGIGYVNYALGNYIKGHGNLENDVEEVLDLYFHQCSIKMSCEDLAHAFLFLANHGRILETKEEILTVSKSKRLSALMLTCGLYDESGDFAFRVGMPGKSGVGGGIAAIIPNTLSIAVWSPELNKCGNSIIGMQALELFTTKTKMSIF